MSGLQVHRPGQDVPAGGLVADRELCLDRSQTRLVEAGSVESAFVLIGKGQTIPASEVKRLGLHVWVDGRVMQGAEPVVEMLHQVDAAPTPDLEVAPLPDIVHPAGAMPEPVREPIMPPEAKRSRKK